MQSNSASPPVISGDEQSASPVLTCVSCGGDNVANSKFCRHCGEALIPSAGTAVAANQDSSHNPTPSRSTADGVVAGSPTADGHTSVAAALVPAAASDGKLDGRALTYEEKLMKTRPSIPPPEGDEIVDRSLEIDHRRARQLLDRAFALAERGDMPAAILACRQSVTLAPNSAPGFSMLGLLLERSGDYEHAIDAYEEVLRLVPDSRLERDSIARLRASLGQQSRNSQFHFDEKELFDTVGTAPPTPPVSGAVSGANAGVVQPKVASVPSAAQAMAPAVAAMAPVPAVDTPSSTAQANGIGVAFPRIGGGSTPTAFDPRSSTVPAVAALDFGVDPSTRNTSVLQKLSRKPSYYFQGTPLMAATALGLLFMAFARNYAAVRQPAPSPVTPATITSETTTAETTTPPSTTTSTDATTPGGASTTGPTTGVVPSPTAATGGVTFDLRNRPAPAAPAVPAAGAPTGVAGASAPASGSGVQTRVAPRPVPNIPAPTNNDIPAGLPPATVTLPSARQEPIIALPDNGGARDSGGSSTGGAPLNPAGSPSRGYIRIQPPRPAPQSAPSRSTSRGAAAERAAAAAARAGRTGSSLDNINSAIESGGGDTGWRYQQRALLFLERGDNARAADDFQTAISAYNDQIRRGENVASAQSGINACRSGLSLAMANMRR